MNSARLPAARGEPVTVTLPCEIDMASSPLAGMELLVAVWARPGVVIADMTGTTFCDAAGARMLAEAHREAVAAGSELRIAAAPHVQGVLALVRLGVVLAVYPTLGAALAGAPPGQIPA